MGIFKKISNLFNPTPQRKDPGYWVTVKCNRCGEIIRTRINLHNDLSLEYGEGDGKTTYFCRKSLLGEQRCFQRVEIELTFDANRNLLERQISGGQFVEE